MDFLHLLLIFHSTLEISETTRDTDTDTFVAPCDDGEPASRQQWTSRYKTITADHSVTQAQEHRDSTDLNNHPEEQCSEAEKSIVLDKEKVSSDQLALFL
jgi:hypothetical protein